jgi:hypothetical protein
VNIIKRPMWLIGLLAIGTLLGSGAARGDLILPWQGSCTSTGDALQVTNYGTGRAISSYTYGSQGLRCESFGTAGSGVGGVASASSGNTFGVYGKATASPSGTGVYGVGGAVGVKAESSTGLALQVLGTSNFVGNVGIGTNQPAWPLTIAKSQAVAQLVTSSSTSGSVIELKSTVITGTLGAINFNNGYDGYPGQIAYDLTNFMTFRTAGDERMRLTGPGRLGIGTTSPDLDLDVRGLCLLGSNGLGAGYMQASSPSGTANVVISSWTVNNHGAVAVCDETGTAQANMHVDSQGHGIVEADTKNFRVQNPRDAATDIVYACIEGPEAAAYVRGTATLVDGEAVVPLPEHFQDIAVEEGMTVQLTPRSAESRGLAVVEQAVDHFVVRELSNGTGNYEFHWRVEAVRKGHEDYAAARPPAENRPAPASR